MKMFILLVLLTGCVVPYGDAPQTSLSESARAGSPIGDLTGLEARLLLLMDDNQDADRAMRLEALRSLLRRGRTWSPEAQRDLVVYLESILAVEERERSDDGVEGFGPIVPLDSGPQPIELFDEGTPVAAPVKEERLDGRGAVPEPIREDVVPAVPETVTPDRSLEAMRDEGLAAAREALSRGGYLEAIGLLDQLGEAMLQAGADSEPDEQLTTLRSEAVDGFVHTERERAGKLFLAARGSQDVEARRRGFEEVVSILEGLLADYPDCSYADAISRNLQLVKRELNDG